MSTAPSLEKRRLPIGIFDSGVGGLTVFAALRARLPGESLLYLGDTARLPYGTKSPQTVVRYAQQAARILVERGVKLLIIACNTASALALDELRTTFNETPVLGVIDPGAEAACAATRNGNVAVIATESTVQGGAYPRAIALRNPDIKVEALACPLFVSLAEEGWHEGDIAESVALRYLSPLFHGNQTAAAPDTLVLGCTHFPALRKAISAVLGHQVTLVDSAATTACAVSDLLAQLQLSHPGDTAPCFHILATDAPARFARIAPAFLGKTSAPPVELIDL